MTETTRDQLAGMLLNNAERQNIAVPLNDAIHKLDRLARLEDGIRALAVKFDRAAGAYRKEGLNGQAELWDMAADKTRALLVGE